MIAEVATVTKETYPFFHMEEQTAQSSVVSGR
jgi:hypothetical protein